MLLTKKQIAKRALPLLLLVPLAAGLMEGCGTKANLSVSKSGFYFDTIITITLYGTEKEDLIDGCFSLASGYENMFSNTIEASEISRLNALAGSGEALEVSDETLELLEKGIYYSKLSDGAFDITIGSLSDLWNFSEISANLTTDDNEADPSVLPSDTDILAALSTVNYEYIEINGNQVSITNPDTCIDLGGIAKGYIADQMKAYLLDKGITSAMINLGGNVLAVGSKPDGSDFRIGVQKPFEGSEVIGVITASDKSCVTSGVYERYYRIDGKLYHHILDLSTGYPCDNGLDSVTIISDSSMDGDALSTTCFALGLEKGRELIESLDGIEAIFVTDDLEIYTTSGIGEDISFEEK